MKIEVAKRGARARRRRGEGKAAGENDDPRRRPKTAISSVLPSSFQKRNATTHDVLPWTKKGREVTARGGQRENGHRFFLQNYVLCFREEAMSVGFLSAQGGSSSSVRTRSGERNGMPLPRSKGNRSACLPAAGRAPRLLLRAVASRDIREDFQPMDETRTLLLVPGTTASGRCSPGSDNVVEAKQERLVVVAGGLEGCRGQAQLPRFVVSGRPGFWCGLL